MSIMAKFTIYAMAITDNIGKFVELNVDSRSLADTFLYINLAGIFLGTVFSFWLKHDLDIFSLKLDQEKNKPSDYCLKVTNIPVDMKPENLQEIIERDLKVNVEYVSYCYDIQDIVEKNESLIKEKKV
jgi:hypothetical protein